MASNGIITEGDCEGQAAFSDIDGDGRLDIVCADSEYAEYDQVTWYKNQITGDFDGDGDVDTADRTILTRNWTGALAAEEGSRTFEQGDADGDGDVDTADLTLLTQNWTGAALPDFAFVSTVQPGQLESTAVDIAFRDTDSSSADAPLTWDEMQSTQFEILL